MKLRWDSKIEARSKSRGKTSKDPAGIDPEFQSKTALKKHQGFKKHESSLIVQIRMGKTGLRAFFFQRGVSDINTPLCRCGIAGDIPARVELYCPELQQEMKELRQTLLPKILHTTLRVARSPQSYVLVVNALNKCKDNENVKTKALI